MQQQQRLLLRLKGLMDLTQEVKDNPDVNIIDASSNGLVTLPREIMTLKHLTQLRLFANMISTLPDELSQCTSLATLTLGKNKLTTVPKCVTELPRLKELQLSWNVIESIPGTVGKLTSLTSLDLSSNKISDLPGELSTLTHLQTLDLNFNRLKKVPSAIYSMTSLEILFLNCNEIALGAEDAAIGNLVKMKRLELQRNNIAQVPKEIGALTALTCLILTENKIKVLPEEICRLTALGELQMGHNELDRLPEGLKMCTALKKLVVDHNCLRELSIDVSGMKDLIMIDAHCNSISVISKSFCESSSKLFIHLGENRISSLECIPSGANDVLLEHNQIRSLPQSLFSNSLMITRFNCCCNGITAISSAIAQWSRTLTSLDISVNCLEVLPPEIGALTSLVSLNVASNRLKALPDPISKLTSLQILFCGYNMLTTIPEWLSAMQSVRVLRAPGNRFTMVPKALCSHPTLNFIDLANNKISSFETPLFLPQLTDIDLSCNCLSDVSCMVTLVSLNTINLSHNAFTTFPKVFLTMSRISLLDLSGNRINEIPSDISKLTHLTRFNMACNRIQFPSARMNKISVFSTGASSADGAAAMSSVVSLAASIPGDARVESIPPSTVFLMDVLPDSTFTRVDGNPDLDKIFILVPDVQQQALLIDSNLGPKSTFVGFSEMCGKRSEMQDSMVVIPSFQGMSRQLLAGLYDGHSGKATSIRISKRIPSVLSSALFKNKDPLAAMRISYEMLNSDVSLFGEGDGATALTIMLRCDSLFVANCGDSRAVLCRGGRAIDLTRQHRPANPDEIKRIQSCGGFVSTNSRVNGLLSVSRAIGDESLQPYVTWEPDLLEHKLVPKEDEFVIMACDGVWDMLSSQQAVSLLRGIQDPWRAACALRDYAYFLGSDDNISVLVVRFCW